MLDFESIYSNLGSFAQVLPTVFGITVTVVAIIVQLAATRYTPRISDLFIKDRINIFVVLFYIFTCLFGVWLAVVDRHLYLNWANIVMCTYLSCITIAFLLLGPYFFYVFKFLNPENIIICLEKLSSDYLKRAKHPHKNLHLLKKSFFETVDQICDIGLNSIDTMERSLCLASMNSLRRVLINYFAVKKDMPAEWFAIEQGNFMGFSSQSTAKIEVERTWVEMAIMKQYEYLFVESVGYVREMIQKISSDAHDIAVEAMKMNLKESLELTISYFNTFLRISLNARNQYAIYNILYQYRALAEEFLTVNEGTVIEIAKYMKYYGQLSVKMSLPFSVVVLAYDLRMLNERAYTVGFSKKKELLDIFISCEKAPEIACDELALRALLKSQAILASYYISVGEETLTNTIFASMASLPKERIKSLKDEILSADKEYYWEVTDRWENFDYVLPARREKIMQFFKMLEEQ